MKCSLDCDEVNASVKDELNSTVASHFVGMTVEKSGVTSSRYSLTGTSLCSDCPLSQYC